MSKTFQIAHPTERVAAIRRELETIEGRRRMLRERAVLLGNYATKVATFYDDANVSGAMKVLAEFDGYLHQATGIVSNRGRVQHRVTGERGDVCSWDRDTVGLPMIAVRWDGDHVPSSVLLLDIRAIDGDEVDGARAGADLH